MPALSVIIVNYNVRSFLENALTSITRAMAGIDGELFVVDNASDDGSAAMVRACFPDVTVIENDRNVGFARANNMAIRQSRGRFILLINPDTVVQEDTFRVMLRFFGEHPEAGLAGCKVLNPDGTLPAPLPAELSDPLGRLHQGLRARRAPPENPACSDSITSPTSTPRRPIPSTR